MDKGFRIAPSVKTSIDTLTVLPGNIDPIAIACYINSRFSKSTSIVDVGMTKAYTDPTLFADALPMVSDKHITEAKNIREYFSNKLLMIELTSNDLTKYRRKLISYLSKKDYAFAPDQISMLLSLPRLYQEDTIIENLKDNYNNSPWETKDHNNVTIETTMTHIGSHNKKSFRHSNNLQGYKITKPDSWLCYWMSDCNDRVYMVEIDLDCPFRNYWESVIEYPFQVQGTPIQHSGKDGLNYYTFREWQIL